MHVEVNDLKKNGTNNGGGENREPGGQTSRTWKMRTTRAKRQLLQNSGGFLRRRISMV